MEGPGNKDNIILIIDGTNLIHRNYYVHSYSKTKSGIHTGGIYGTIRSLKSYINNYNPIQLYIAFDKSEHTFRNEIYPEYKMNRRDSDPKLLNQFPILEEYCRLANIPFIEMDLYEADDIIGSLSLHAKEYNLHPYVISGDKDLLQLMDKGIDIIYLSNHGPVIYTEDKFIEEYDIKPNQFIEYKALVGDPSDNIPGIPMVGKKTAAKLLGEYGTLKGIYENVDNIKGKLKERILEHKEDVFLFRELLTIRCDLNLNYDDSFMRYIEEGFDLDNRRAKEFLNELEIRF